MISFPERRTVACFGMDSFTTSTVSVNDTAAASCSMATSREGPSGAVIVPVRVIGRDPSHVGPAHDPWSASRSE